jgi:hypothetical protein
VKKGILITIFFQLLLCCVDGEEILKDPSYSVEGKWLWSPSENRLDANTMYEFIDGLRYTYYCVTCPADEVYWNSLDINDALPSSNAYTFDNDTLKVDLNYGNELITTIIFKCDGGEAYFETPQYSLFRLNSDCN